MAITPDYVSKIFTGLLTGDGRAFFEHVADDVDWTVMGTHPLAGHYCSKRAFQDAVTKALPGFLAEFTPSQLTASGTPTPVRAIVADSNSSNIGSPSYITFGPLP